MSPEVNESLATFLHLCHMQGMVKVFVVWYQTYIKSYKKKVAPAVLVAPVSPVGLNEMSAAATAAHPNTELPTTGL
jgi:hypothetical protein